MKYFKKIIGDRIYLSPMNKDDTEIYTKWLNDAEVSANLGQYSRMFTLQNEQKFLEDITSSGKQNFSIVTNDGDTLLGSIGIDEPNHINRSAVIGLFIGEKENRGKGYGAEALRLMLNYCFKTLNLHNIMLYVYSNNEQGIACYKKVGFSEMGRRREAKFKDGEYVDIIYMDILSREFITHPQNPI